MSELGNQGKRGYRKFVLEGIQQGLRTPWDDVPSQAVMGSEEFVKQAMNRGGGAKGKKTGIIGPKELLGVKPEVIMGVVEKYYGIKPEKMKEKGWRYTEPRYVASYLMRRYGFMGLQEIGEQVGLHFSAVDNAVQRVSNNPTRNMAQALTELENRFKNKEC